jgi:hypothetical protein
MNNLRKRPRDPTRLAKLMIDVASGEVEDRNSMLCVSSSLAVVGLSFQLGECAGNIAHSPMLGDLAVTNAEMSHDVKRRDFPVGATPKYSPR